MPRYEQQAEIGTTAAIIDNLSVLQGPAQPQIRRRDPQDLDERGLDAVDRREFRRHVRLHQQPSGRRIGIDGGLKMLGARRTYYFAYAQDEWKVRPNLTLSLGARYEYYSVIREKYDRMYVFDTNDR